MGSDHSDRVPSRFTAATRARIFAAGEGPFTTRRRLGPVPAACQRSLRPSGEKRTSTTYFTARGTFGQPTTPSVAWTPGLPVIPVTAPKTRDSSRARARRPAERITAASPRETAAAAVS